MLGMEVHTVISALGRYETEKEGVQGQPRLHVIPFLKNADVSCTQQWIYQLITLGSPSVIFQSDLCLKGTPCDQDRNVL